MIIDAHMHVDEIPALSWKLDAAECTRRLDDAGIEKRVVMAILGANAVRLFGL